MYFYSWPEVPPPRLHYLLVLLLFFTRACKRQVSHLRQRGYEEDEHAAAKDSDLKGPGSYLGSHSFFFFSQLGVWASWRKAVSPKKSWNSRSSKSQFCVSMRGWTIRGVKNIFKCNQQLSGWISGLLYKKKHMPGVVNLAKNLGLLSSQAPWVNSWQLFC